MNCCVSKAGNIMTDTNYLILDGSCIFENIENLQDVFKLHIDEYIKDQSFNQTYVKISNSYEVCETNIQYFKYFLKQKIDHVGSTYYMVKEWDNKEFDENISLKAPLDDYGNIYNDWPKVEIEPDIFVQDKFYI